MKKLHNALLILLFVSSSCSSQDNKFTAKEKKCIQIFNGFIVHVHNAIGQKTGLTDSAELAYLISKYLFTNSKLDSSDEKNLNINELSINRLNHLRTELSSFYRYLQEREDAKLTENLMLTPIRLSKEIYIYEKLTSFQKENTFIFYDKRFPDKTLGYILFMPPIKQLMPMPKIWSWILVFKFGKYVFKSITGQEGYEYIFSSSAKKELSTE